MFGDHNPWRPRKCTLIQKIVTSFCVGLFGQLSNRRKDWRHSSHWSLDPRTQYFFSTALVSLVPILHLFSTVVNCNYDSYQCNRDRDTSPHDRGDVGRVLIAVVASTICMRGCRGAGLDRRR